MAAARDAELLEVHRATAFTFNERGRMVYESAPDRSRGKRFSLAGCHDGNLVVIRDDVSDFAAGELQRLAGDEPPLSSPEAMPIHLDEYQEVLDGAGSAVEHLLGLLWVLPGPLTFDHDAHLVWSATSEGDRVLAEFADVMPSGLLDTGFRTPADLWEPWCVALVGGQVASIAESVRTGPHGAEVGVDTAVGFRGHGLAAAATAGWSAHPELADRALFYSTGRDNTSSRRVTERLGLRFLGSTFAVP